MDNDIAAGRWETNWTGAPGFDPYEGDDGTRPDGGAGEILHSLTAQQAGAARGTDDPPPWGRE